MYCDLWALSECMTVGLAPAIVADERAMDFGFVVAAPMQRQIAATKPIATEAILNEEERSIMSSNVKLRGAALLRRPS